MSSDIFMRLPQQAAGDPVITENIPTFNPATDTSSYARRSTSMGQKSAAFKNSFAVHHGHKSRTPFI